jgi:hypothetical protein
MISVVGEGTVSPHTMESYKAGYHTRKQYRKETIFENAALPKLPGSGVH